MSRRGLLIGGALALAWVIGAPRLIRLTQPEFAFEDVPGLPGFRSLGLGRGPGNIALLGIGDTVPEPPRDPCAAIFGAGDGRLPVAVFTDYFCPYCPEVSRLAASLEKSGAPVQVTWHEWPVLGPRSEELARVALAAGMQGRYLDVHSHLMQSHLRPGRRALAALAEQFGLDADRLERDMSSAQVSAQLDASRALAAVLGIPGTPGLTVGRTVTAGRIIPARLDRLIAREAQDRIC